MTVMAEQDSQLDEQEPEKHAGGRPPKFATPEEMQVAIDAYFAECDPHWVEVEYLDYPIIEEEEELEPQGHGGALKRKKSPRRDHNAERTLQKRWEFSYPRPYTMTGLALAIGFESRQSLADYKKRGKFSYTIKKAKMLVEEQVEQKMLASNGVVAGVIFNAKVNFGWVETQHIDVTSKGKSIAPKIVSDVTRDAPTQTKAAPSNPTDQESSD
jgi:hypothetical protein